MRHARLRLATAFPFSLVALSALAQAPPAPQLIREGYAAGTAFLVRNGSLSLDEWRAMLPGSSLLRDDLPARVFDHPWYGPTSYYDDPHGAGIARSPAGAYLAVGLDPDRTATADARFEQRLRTGISFGGAEESTRTWARSLTGAHDTLVSQATGALYELDSTWTESYVATVRRSRLALDGSWILRKATRRRMSWYAGGGMLLGLDHNGRAEVQRTISRYREESLGRSSSESTVAGEEAFRLEPTLCLGVHALLGLDLKLGKTSPFWSSLHLFWEWRHGLLATRYPGVAASLASGSQQLLGLRVDLD